MNARIVPEQMADMARYLCLDSASYIAVDGSWSAGRSLQHPLLHLLWNLNLDVGLKTGECWRGVPHPAIVLPAAPTVPKRTKCRRK